jgi:GNAT superfamily N-acetyltransferase
VSRYAPVELLTTGHDTSTFDCGSEQQTVWLRRYALIAQQSGTARVYVTRRTADDRVAAYYALAAGSILADDAPARVAAGTGRHPIPVLILTRLGVDTVEQGRGLGRALVRDALQRAATAAGSIGIRAMLIHAETARAAEFYRQIDPAFTPSPADPLQLVILMKDVRAAIERAASSKSCGQGDGE